MRISRALIAAGLFAAALTTVPMAASAAPDANASATTNPTSLTFAGFTDIGTASVAQTVTVTSTGSSPIKFGNASITGQDFGNFAIFSDTCSRNQLNTGQSCTIAVEAFPYQAGVLHAALTIPDNSTAGSNAVSLTATGRTSATGAFFPLAPDRILDTRTGVNTPITPLGQGKVLTAQVAGAHGSGAVGVPAEGASASVPSGSISAAVVNITVTGGTAPSYLTVYADGSSRPTVSSINFGKGQTVANGITVPLSANGAIDIYNQSGSVQVIVDVVGYYGATDALIGDTAGGGGLYNQSGPTRLFDSRSDKHGALLPNQDVTIPFTLPNAFFNSQIRALAINVTAVDPAAAGYLSVHPSNTDPHSASTLNFAKSQTVPNSAVVPVCPMGTCVATLPSISVFNGSTGTTDAIVDVVGYFDDGSQEGGLRFHPTTPTRIADSRTGLGIAHAMGPQATVAVTPPTYAADPQTVALAINVTAVAPTAKTYLSVWPDQYTKPNTSILNPAAGQTVADGSYAGIGPSGKFDVFNQSGTVNVVIDVTGRFDTFGNQTEPPTSGGGFRPMTPTRKISQ